MRIKPEMLATLLTEHGITDELKDLAKANDLIIVAACTLAMFGAIEYCSEIVFPEVVKLSISKQENGYVINEGDEMEHNLILDATDVFGSMFSNVQAVCFLMACNKSMSGGMVIDILDVLAYKPTIQVLHKAYNTLIKIG